MIEIDVISDTAGLLALEPDWWGLWSRLPDASPFTSPAWLIPWWQVFGPGELMSVAVRQEGRLVAFAPLYIEHGRWGRRLLPLGISLSDYADLLIDPGCAETAGAALLDGLGARGAQWDLWSAEEAPACAAVLRLRTPAGWSSVVEPQSPCPVLPLPLPLPQRSCGLAEVVPRAKLRKWRMACNRVERRNPAFEAANASTVGPMLAELARLHEARWRSKGEPGVLADACIRRFHAEAAPRLLDAGLLRLKALSIGGTVAGVYYGLGRSGRSYAYLGGFDPDFAFESPGTLLLGAAIEEAVAEGAREFHFLRGAEAYKFAWGAELRHNSRRTFKAGP